MTTHDGHTVGVGPAHTLDADGACLQTCPHPEHDGPITVTFAKPLIGPLRDWLEQMDLRLQYFPTTPDENGGMLQYVATVAPDSDLARALAAPAGPRMAAARNPRTRRPQ